MTSIYLIADLIGRDLVIRRYANQSGRWMCLFENGEVMDRGALVGVFGNGVTPTEAVQDYCKQIVGCRMAFDAMTPARRTEFTMPADLGVGSAP